MGTLAEDCILRYEFNENAPDNFVADGQGNHNAALIVAAGNDYTEDIHEDSANPPYTGGRFYFEGLGRCIKSTLLPGVFTDMTTITFEFFIKTQATDNPDQMLFGVHQSFPHFDIYCNLNHWDGAPPGTLIFYALPVTGPAMSFEVDPAVLFSDGGSYHMVLMMKMSAGSAELYVNNVSKGLNISSAGTEVDFGALGEDHEFYINAYNDLTHPDGQSDLTFEFFRMYNRALTTDEIAWLYNGGKCRGGLSPQQICFDTTVKPLIIMESNVKEC